MRTLSIADIKPAWKRVELTSSPLALYEEFYKKKHSVLSMNPWKVLGKGVDTHSSVENRLLY